MEIHNLPAFPLRCSISRMDQDNQTLVLYFFIFLFVSISSAVHSDDETNPIVQTPQGWLKGRAQLSRNGREFYEFLGIPYAKPPVRFEAPERPDKWNGTRDAFNHAEQCVQYSIDAEGVEHTIGKEDCLYLNVHTPTLEDAKLPVMVYIRDGFFQIHGKGNEYGFQYFMDENVVLVDFSYRLNAFGFFSTGDEVVQGNMGLKDQVMALHWVQENIRAFGGDETEVTLFGVDAGAASVSLHILSPMSEGLFNKAILQSGTALNPWALSYFPQESSLRITDYLGCLKSKKGVDKYAVACLKRKSASQIVSVNLKKWNDDPLVDFMPVVEKITPGAEAKSQLFLPDDPTRMYREGRFKKVPIIIGVTSHNGLMHHALGIIRHEEVLAKLNQQKYFKDISAVTFYYEGVVPDFEYADISEAIKMFYFGEQEIGYFTIDNLTNVYSDRLFNQGARNVALYHAKHAPVYPYIFAFNPDLPKFDYSDSPFHFDVGPEHGKDILYMFTLMNSEQGIDGMYEKGSAKDVFMKSFIKLWVSFAKTGKPSKLWGSTKKWPAISSKNLKKKNPVEWLKITENPHLVQSPFEDRVQFWNDLLDPYYNEMEDEELGGLEDIIIEADTNPIFKLVVGTVKGLSMESRQGKIVYCFLGIPYANQPERFEPATEFVYWDGVRESTSYGPDCMQLEFQVNPRNMNKVVGSEDCLYLNVYAPKEVDMLNPFRPVLVVFRDYGFAHGTSRGIGGQHFNDEGMIVVTVNYRLGALGFLNTGDGVLNGNLGLKDQNFALEWVHDNIERVFGDPKRVTIMGLGSGGSASVTYHVLSKMSKGLFNAAIAHSGSALCPWAFIQEPRQAAVSLAERLDCPTYDSKNLVSCLKAKSARDIVKQKFFRWYRDPMTTFGPSIEIISSMESQKYTTFLDEHPLSLWRSGKINQVPLIIGTMSLETIMLYSYGIYGGFFSSYQEELEDDWKKLLPIALYYERTASPEEASKISEKIKNFYLGDHEFEDIQDNARILVNYTEMFTHRLFLHGVKQAAKLHAKFAPVYPYQFIYHRNIDSDNNYEAMWGTGHEDDIEYFMHFDYHANSLSDSLFTADRNPSPGSPEEKFSINLVRLWTSFIDVGRPLAMYRTEYDIAQNNPPVEWRKIEPQNIDGNPPTEPIMWFMVHPIPQSRPEPFQEQMDFWDSIVKNFDNDLLLHDDEDYEDDHLLPMKDEL